MQPILTREPFLCDNMNILLIGYYGFGNFGDEWLCRQSKQILQDHYPSCQIKVATQSPTDSNHVNRRSLFSMISAILWSDYIIFGGGGIFQNQTSRLSPFYYAAIIMASLILRRPYGLMGQSIGPLFGRFTTWMIQFLLKRASLCAFRDYAPAFTPAIISPDLGYYKASFLPNSTSTGKIAICFRQAWITPDLTQFLQTNTASISLICQDEQDLHYQKTIFLSNQSPPNLSLVISMRYHACVWASLQGIPFIALGDDPKLDALAAACEQSHLPISKAHLLPQKIKDYHRYWDHYQQLLAQKIPKFISAFYPLQVALSTKLNTI